MAITSPYYISANAIIFYDSFTSGRKNSRLDANEIDGRHFVFGVFATLTRASGTCRNANSANSVLPSSISHGHLFGVYRVISAF